MCTYSAFAGSSSPPKVYMAVLGANLPSVPLITSYHESNSLCPYTTTNSLNFLGTLRKMKFSWN